MRAEGWTQALRDFERLREMRPAEREPWLREREQHDDESGRVLRELIAADGAADPLLDSDLPTLHAAWSEGGDEPVGIGSEIAGYRIVSVLGEGGSATVYRAEREGVPSVAIKVLKPEACSPGLSRRFEQEQDTLTALEHQDIIRVLGAGRLADRRPYLITEHVAGERIDVHCERAALDLPARLRLFVLVCRAVHHAHSHLVVHRDLKPSNILVDAEGRPKVLDFGVAKLLDPERDPLWTDLYGQGPLTPAYASPEQIRGEAITTATDVYSLGVLLFEFATGASPYEQAPAEREALRRAVIAGHRRSPQAAATSRGRPPPPRDVATILERALALHPRDRYASAEHLAQDIECFLANRPLLSKSEPWSRRAARLARRRPWTLATCAALALVLLGSWIGAERSLRRVMASESVAWRAHANAVQSTNLLADLLEQIGSSAVADEELARRTAETDKSLADLAGQPEAEARLRTALARLERARGNSGTAEAHIARAVELSRDTRGLSWNDTERGLEIWCDLLAQRGDAGCLPLARERFELLAARGDTERAEEARKTLEALIGRFGPR
ncbi:MAG: serine/threonine protein kinase [Planctomycetota bacterium]